MAGAGRSCEYGGYRRRLCNVHGRGFGPPSLLRRNVERHVVSPIVVRRDHVYAKLAVRAVRGVRLLARRLSIDDIAPSVGALASASRETD